MNKKIAIVCYSFPPYPGIGGRRWAKFAKLLAAKGYEVHIIGAKNIFSTQSEWTKDTSYPNIRYDPIETHYPEVLIKGPKSFADKLKYRYWLAWVKRNYAGNIYDRSAFMEAELEQKLTRIIKQQEIKNLIVSIPPYKMAYTCCKLKDKFKDLNVIVDYRDPWTTNTSKHGFTAQSAARLQKEKAFEKVVLEKADHILSVSEEMSADLRKVCIASEKIKTLTNGYDEEDISKNGITGNDNKLRFVYAGTLYSNMENVLNALVKQVMQLKETNKALFDKLSIEFYGNHNPDAAKIISDANCPALIVNKPVPLAEMHAIIGSAACCMLMPPPDYQVIFNSKFFEYLVNRKPILLFSHPCYSADFITKNKLGFHINSSNTEVELSSFFKEIENKLASFNNEFDISGFSLPMLTQELEKLFV